MYTTMKIRLTCSLVGDILLKCIDIMFGLWVVVGCFALMNDRRLHNSDFFYDDDDDDDDFQWTAFFPFLGCAPNFGS